MKSPSLHFDRSCRRWMPAIRTYSKHGMIRGTICQIWWKKLCSHIDNVNRAPSIPDKDPGLIRPGTALVERDRLLANITQIDRSIGFFPQSSCGDANNCEAEVWPRGYTLFALISTVSCTNCLVAFESDVQPRDGAHGETGTRHEPHSRHILLRVDIASGPWVPPEWYIIRAFVQSLGRAASTIGPGVAKYSLRWLRPLCTHGLLRLDDLE
jgi:hypothetical protein